MITYIAWSTTLAAGIFMGNLCIFLSNLAYARYREKKDKPVIEAYQKQLNTILDKVRAERLGALVSLGSVKTH